MEGLERRVSGPGTDEGAADVLDAAPRDISGPAQQHEKHDRPRDGNENRRQSFLTLSLDLASMQRDVAAFWKRSWYWEGDPKFSYVPTPDERSRARKAKKSPEAPISFNDRLKERHEEWFEQLRQADIDYRDILSTVSSLGSSADAFRTGRLALWVAVVSLIVAVATVLVSQVDGKSLFKWIWQMISG